MSSCLPGLTLGRPGVGRVVPGMPVWMSTTLRLVPGVQLVRVLFPSVAWAAVLRTGRARGPPTSRRSSTSSLRLRTLRMTAWLPEAPRRRPPCLTPHPRAAPAPPCHPHPASCHERSSRDQEQESKHCPGPLTPFGWPSVTCCHRKEATCNSVCDYGQNCTWPPLCPLLAYRTFLLPSALSLIQLILPANTVL